MEFPAGKRLLTALLLFLCIGLLLTGGAHLLLHADAEPESGQPCAVCALVGDEAPAAYRPPSSLALLTTSGDVPDAEHPRGVHPAAAAPRGPPSCA